MLMPDNFEIREDGTLVLIVNEVEYEFKEMDDFIYSDKKKIILKTSCSHKPCCQCQYKGWIADSAQQSRLRLFRIRTASCT